jgi:hypothetical protein
LEEHFGNEPIIAGQAFFAIDDENDEIGLLDRDLDLSPNLGLERNILDLDAAGIDDREVFGEPIGARIKTIAGDARSFFDDGFTLPDDAVE